MVRLRALEETDLPRINEGIWNPNVSRNLSVAFPQSLAGTREFWDRARREGAFLFAVETLAGELIGVCDLGLHQRVRAGELGIWIAEPYWDRGYGTDAVRTLCRFGFREMNLQRVGLMVFETNRRGVRAYEKVGFKEEGRVRPGAFVDGEYVDVIQMGLLAEDLADG